MEKKNSILLVFATAAISGVSIFLNKYAVKGIDSDIFTFSKNILVAIFILSLIMLLGGLGQLRQLKKKDWAGLAAIGLVGGSIPFLLYFKGLQIASAAGASLIHKAMFVFVAVFASIFLKEKISKLVFIAGALLLAGNYLLLSSTLRFESGLFLIIAATLLWAVENVMSKHALKNLSGNVVAFGRMFFGSAFILVYLLITGKLGLILSITESQLHWIFFTAGLLLLYVLTWYNGLKNTNVSLATAILLLGSPITTIISAFMGSAVAVSQLLGIFLIIIGVFFYFRAVAPSGETVAKSATGSNTGKNG